MKTKELHHAAVDWMIEVNIYKWVLIMKWRIDRMCNQLSSIIAFLYYQASDSE